MKSSLFFLSLIFISNWGFSQNANYETLWKTVEKHEVDGLPKTALEVVETINKLAKKDKNDPQLIKAMLYKSKFALVLEEDAQLKIRSDFKNEIANSTLPTKNILESLLANMYWQYFNQNRWQFYNRTKTAEKVTPNDFRTWDLQTLFDDIHLHFQNSLQYATLLQQEPLSKYDAILNLQKDSKIYRPTLFDFLSHEALNFYKTTETAITKPAYTFEIDNPEFLADANTFSNLVLDSKDATSLQLHALKIYQELICFHLNDTKPDALTDVNLERLKFVNQHATFSDKELLLLNALKSESEKLKKHAVSGLYDFEIASIYYQQSTQFQPNNTEKGDSNNYQYKAKEAFALCNNIIEKFPMSHAAEKSAVLKQQILQQTLKITSEHFIPIQHVGRLLINYKNIDVLEFKLFKITQNQLEKFNRTYRKEEKREFLNNLIVLNAWESKLRNENDYQKHSTEIAIPKLGNGTYMILASTKNDNETFAFTNIQVTNLALVENDNSTFKTFQIIDRTNGKPMVNAQVELSFTENNKSNPKKTLVTNNLGTINIEKTSDRYRNVNAKVTYGNDTAYFGDYYLNQFYERITEETNYKAFLFTDRSIYRPGQTVYFKAIAMKTSKGTSEIIANERVYATLYNVNAEEIAKLELKTNDYGSVAGEFILPSSGLNGEYHIAFGASGISDVEATSYFSVEEYKRPKFETKFTPITETYKVNDSVTVKGTALAYAGSNITDAKVVYRVHRKVEYPRWYFWYRPWFNSEPQEITHGESVTDASGNFEITFKALPDQSVDKSSLPVFNYEITADVTDVNGETRSATTTVNVGYHALLATMTLAEKIDKNEKDITLAIDTKNLNGEFVPAKGVVKIYKLQAPNRVLRNRPWAAPDYQDFSEEAFKNRYPHDAYSNEHLAVNWKKGTLVFEKTFDTETSKTLDLGNLKNWESGQYSITLESTDTFGQLVKDEAKTILYGDDDKTVADNQLFRITTNKPSYKVGETAMITIASAAENLHVTVSVEKNQKVIKTEIIQLNNNKKNIAIPVTSEDVGGFAVRYSFAAFNSFKSGATLISVPYPNTDLDIETTTFRDKLQPGTDETWRFKIKGPQGDKVTAELLASMYDASLDQFKPHAWNFNPIDNPFYSSNKNSNANQSFGTINFNVYNKPASNLNYTYQSYDQLNWFGFSFGTSNAIRIREIASYSKGLKASVSEKIVQDSYEVAETVMSAPDMGKDRSLMALPESPAPSDLEEKPTLNNIQIRKNLQETAFFFPQLLTDKDGNVSFSFKTPEALTQWKLQLVAHTKTLESTTKTLTTVTQKELMVTPNAPRFLRHGDTITISTKIANLTDKQLSGKAQLILTDAITGKDISSKLLSPPPSGELEGDFIAPASGNTQVSWNLTIPDDVDAVQYKILATSGSFSDGEQNALPVLSNRMLVTETLPMWIRSFETRTFTLDKLLTNTSTTLKNHKLTLEMTSNPAWYAVQALPYLMEYPYECNEQTFSRFYANALASHIATSNPRIQQVFNQWKNTDALISNLEKNEELKSILIQETPWLRDAQSETEQKKRIALLFDLNKMTSELQAAKNKLEANQLSNGAWAWFQGGRENRYITQHIITGFGHLNHLNVQTQEVSNMIEKAIQYLDDEFVQEYKDLKKYDAKVDLSKDHLSNTQLHYLYMRSFYPEIKRSKDVETISNYYKTQIQTYWLSRSLYQKGLMALVVRRMDDTQTAAKILKSLKENSITSNELGMYWKENTNSWYWYQAPIETQALLIEVFSEIDTDIYKTKTIDNLKIWLLKNKQTNQWKTTKATTDAVYALLLQGSDWLSVTDAVDVVLGGQKIAPSNPDSYREENVKVEAGTGYYKTAWNTSEIKPEMATVTLTKKGEGIAWGSLYWQYFEDLDKISSAETPLKLKKTLFLKKNTDIGEQISEISNNTSLKVGDLVRVRIELQSDRPMEFVHMKDMRAAGLEPVNVLSQYKWQDGLGYYESTKDAATNFFFDDLPKGIFVFEYDLRVNNAGNMSNGITTIQSMYAPEFSSHSDGVRLLVN